MWALCGLCLKVGEISNRFEFELFWLFFFMTKWSFHSTPILVWPSAGDLDQGINLEWPYKITRLCFCCSRFVSWYQLCDNLRWSVWLFHRRFHKRTDKNHVCTGRQREICIYNSQYASREEWYHQQCTGMRSFWTIWHSNKTPTMQFFTWISRNTQSNSYTLLLTECVWDFQKNALWDTH